MPAGAGFTGQPGYWGPAASGLGSVAGDGYGGFCIVMLATAALNVGEAVFVSAADHVNKGATANLAATLGVVVGGKLTKGRCYPEVKIGDAAAGAAEDWGIPEREMLSTSRRTIAIDQTEGGAGQPLGQLARIGNGGAGADETGIGPIMAAYPPEAPHDVGHIGSEDAAIDVDFVADHIAEVREEASPAGVVG